MDINKSLIKQAKAGNLAGVKSLVEQGADIHYDNNEPLHIASCNGHLEVVKYFIEHKTKEIDNLVDIIRNAVAYKKHNVVEYLITLIVPEPYLITLTSKNEKLNDEIQQLKAENAKLRADKEAVKALLA